MDFNFLGGTGYLTEKQRKNKLEHNVNQMWFKTCIDLSEPIEIRLFGNTSEISSKTYADEIATFICWWTRNVFPSLDRFTGFPEFRNINFKIKN